MSKANQSGGSSFNMYVSAIILAAGKGLRFSRPDSVTKRDGIPTRISKMIKSGKSKVSKVLVEIGRRPIIIYCLDTFSKHPDIKDIVVVANSKNSEDITNRIREYKISKIKDVILGGPRRQDSVLCGLKVIDQKTDLVLIHDGVRPFIQRDTISSAIKQAKKCGAAIAGVPVKATIKRVTGYGLRVTGKFLVKETIDRNNLWEIQTPQVFRKDLILSAFEKFEDAEVSDDSALLEKLGVEVSVVLGSYNNIKITTPEDLIIAEAIASRCLVFGSRCSDKNR